MRRFRKSTNFDIKIQKKQNMIIYNFKADSTSAVNDTEIENNLINHFFLI